MRVAANTIFTTGLCLVEIGILWVILRTMNVRTQPLQVVRAVLLMDKIPHDPEYLIPRACAHDVMQASP